MSQRADLFLKAYAFYKNIDGSVSIICPYCGQIHMHNSLGIVYSYCGKGQYEIELLNSLVEAPDGKK